MGKFARWFIAIILFLVSVIVIVLGYRLNWDWAGLSSYTPPTKDSNFQRGKTLWDWLQLLIIPAALAFAGYIFTLTTSNNEQRAAEQRSRTEHEIALDNQQEAALQDYIDKLSELLLEKNLRESKLEDEVRKVARARTLTVLPRLDAKRKKTILQFLYESGLIDKDTSIVDLREADLSEAYLGEAYLGRAHLGGTNLSGSYLSGAYLGGANLSRTYLIRTDPTFRSLLSRYILCLICTY